MSEKKLISRVAMIVALFLYFNARADYIKSMDRDGLIPIVNRSFVEPNDGIHNAFDIEISRQQVEPFLGNMTTDVPGWSTDVSPRDSGIDPDVGGTLMGGYSEWDDESSWVEPSIWQILGYKIQAGDQFKLAVDSSDLWTQHPEVFFPTLKMSLFYVARGGARRELVSQRVVVNNALKTYVLDLPHVNNLAVGHLLGIELQNVTNKNSWISVNNVSLIGGSGESGKSDASPPR